MILPSSLRQLPQQGAQINWANPITRGLVFLYVPGIPWDMAGRSGSAQFSGAASRSGSSLVLPGSAANGLTLGSGVQLGSLQNSTVIALATSPNTNRAFYTERAPAGNDIFKLESSPFGGAQFTYRNDAGNLLQLDSGNASITDGTYRLFAATKNGTAHAAYCGPVAGGNSNGSLYKTATGTFGSTSTAFSNAGIVRSIGYDVADNSASLAGRVDVVAGWARTLSEDEISSIRANPGQLIAAPSNRATLAAITGVPSAAPVTPPVVTPPAGDGGGAGPVREVRRFADLLDRVQKPTRSQKKARRMELEAEALELLPDFPEAEKLAPIAARIVYEQEARALAPLYANRPIQALQPVEIPFDAHAALREMIDKLLTEAIEQQKVAEDEENDIELLLFGT